MVSRVKGILFMLGSSLCFSLMSAAAKYTREVPLPEKLFVRNIFAVIVALFLLIKNGEAIKGNNKKFLFLRGIIGFAGALCYFYALNHLPLGDVTLLNKVSPFFVIILSALFLGEKFYRHHIPVLIMGLLGAGLVLKPGFQYNLFAAFLALISALTSGISYTIIRYLRKTDSPQMILLYFSGISALGTIPLMFLWGVKMPSMPELVGLLLMGTFTAISQLCLNHAYRYAPAGELSVYDYTTILFSAAIGLLAWSEIPDIMSMLGGILIIGAGILNYRMNSTVLKVEATQD